MVELELGDDQYNNEMDAVPAGAVADADPEYPDMFDSTLGYPGEGPFSTKRPRTLGENPEVSRVPTKASQSAINIFGKAWTLSSSSDSEGVEPEPAKELKPPAPPPGYKVPTFCCACRRSEVPRNISPLTLPPQMGTLEKNGTANLDRDSELRDFVDAWYTLAAGFGILSRAAHSPPSTAAVNCGGELGGRDPHYSDVFDSTKGYPEKVRYRGQCNRGRRPRRPNSERGCPGEGSLETDGRSR